MSAPLSVARLHERGCAIARGRAAGGRLGCLATLARRGRRGLVTDWPGRQAGTPELRQGWDDASPPPGWPEAYEDNHRRRPGR